MADGTEIQPYQTQELSPQQFDQALAFGQAKAQALKALVEQRGLFTEIQGRKHLQVEAWETIAEGYGLSARVEWSRPLENGGWEARASVVDRQGNIVGGAEAECGTEGDGNWLERASFQQRSMAQTRAISKALRSRLSWVVVLAGYSPTPAEEMIAGETAPKQSGENWCAEHKAAWFKRGKMKNYAHPIGDTGEWCNKPAAATPKPAQGLEPAPTDLGVPTQEGDMLGPVFWDEVRKLGVHRQEQVTAYLGVGITVWLSSGRTYRQALETLKERKAAQGQAQEASSAPPN